MSEILNQGTAPQFDTYIRKTTCHDIQNDSAATEGHDTHCSSAYVAYGTHHPTPSHEVAPSSTGGCEEETAPVAGGAAGTQLNTACGALICAPLGGGDKATGEGVDGGLECVEGAADVEDAEAAETSAGLSRIGGSGARS